MFAWRTIKPNPSGPMQHLPIDPDIDASGIRMRGQRYVAGADIAATVARPEFWHRKRSEVDHVFPQDDFVDRGDCRRNAHRRYASAHDIAGCRDHLRYREIGMKTDRERITLFAGTEHVREHASAEAIAVERLEQQG